MPLYVTVLTEAHALNIYPVEVSGQFTWFGDLMERRCPADERCRTLEGDREIAGPSAIDGPFF